MEHRYRTWDMFVMKREMMVDVYCCRRRDGEDKILECWGWRKGDICCGRTKK